MKRLANFSIETDTSVLLVFEDGTQSRVATRQLSRHLEADDLQRVRRAIKMRRDFLRQHLPKAGLAIALAGALLAAGLAGEQRLANHQHHGPQAAAAVSDQAATPLPTPTPSATPPAVLGAATQSSSPTKHQPHRTAVDHPANPHNDDFMSGFVREFKHFLP